MSIAKTPCDAGVILAPPDPAPSDGARRAALAAAIIGSSMTFIDGTVVNVALPVLRSQLGATVAEAQWVVEAYMLFLASLVLAGGAIGDRWGRRYVFVLGTVAFAAASAWCGMASGITQLILARGAQGIGAALLVPGSLALISANFDRERRGRAIGTWAALTSMAAGAGPLLGGWLVEAISWRWIFFINLPLAGIAVAIARRVPESRAEPVEGPVDWPGAALATAGLLCLVFGLIEWGGGSLTSASAMAGLVLGAAGLAAFVVREARARHPMLPLEIFGSPTFTGANLLTLFLYCGLGATMFVLPFTLIDAHGYSAVTAAATLLPFVAIMFLLSAFAGGLMDRYGPRLPLTLGPLIAAAGFLLFLPAARGGSYWDAVFPAVMVMSVGMAISVAPLTATVMSSAGGDRMGLASGINNAVARVASLLAVAGVGVLVDGAIAGGLTRVAWASAILAVAGAASAFVFVRPDAPAGRHT